MSRQRIIERERRWRLPAALTGLAALALALGSVPIEQGAVEGDGAAEQLRSIDEHTGTFLLASAIRGLGLLCLAGPLLYLFFAAKARSDAVRGFFVFFVVAGPALFGAQGVAGAFAIKDAAAAYVEVAAQPAPGYDELVTTLERNPESIDRVTFYEDADAMDVEPDSQDPYTVELPPTAPRAPSDENGTPEAKGETGGQAAQEQPADAAGDESTDPADQLESLAEDGDVETDTDEDGEPGDAVAADVADDSEAQATVTTLLLPALLALIAGIFYPSLHGMRVGLLTRFFGTLGMAIAVSVLFLGLWGVLLYGAALGVLIAGRWPGGRPPAWERGEAVPWPRPGEEPAPPRDEGSEDAESAELPTEAGSPHAERRARARKRKRKRRQ